MNPLYNSYFQLQFRRMNRLSLHLGAPLWVFLGMIGLSFLALSALIFWKTGQYAPYIYGGLSLYLLFSVSNQQGIAFLSSILQNQDFRFIRMLENSLLVLPFLIVLLVKGFFLVAALLLSGAILLALLQWTFSSSLVIPNPFAERPFEYIINFRVSIILYLLSYILTFIAVYVGNFNLSIFALMTCFFISMKGYSFQEPLTYIKLHRATAKGFLYRKAKDALINSTIIASPLFVPILICFPQNALIISLVSIMGFLYILAALMTKYAHYPVSINLIQGIVLASGICLPPLLLLIIPFFYHKAILNLRAYLNSRP